LKNLYLIFKNIFYHLSSIKQIENSKIEYLQVHIKPEDHKTKPLPRESTEATQWAVLVVAAVLGLLAS
jgi:hypothetical protein